MANVDKDYGKSSSEHPQERVLRREVKHQYFFFAWLSPCLCKARSRYFVGKSWKERSICFA
jgi:hypothetical protein